MTRSAKGNAPAARSPMLLRCAAVALLALAGALSCGESGTAPTGPVVTTITASRATGTEVPVGETVQLEAAVLDQYGQPMPSTQVAWTSDSPATATVDGSGLVTAVANGTATIAASVGSVRATLAVKVGNADRTALVALYEATDGPNWVDNTNWLTDAPLGDWYGVEADTTGRVVRLDLGSNQLTGEIPPEIGELTNLRSLGLYANSLTGEIPSEIGRLVNLEELNLSGGDLSGEIPVEIGNLVSLRWLSVNRNRLTGEIPVEIGNLASLRTLSIIRNQLTGPIPSEIGNLASLRNLSIGDNQLTGLIPSSFLQLRLASFFISGNESLCMPGTSVFVSWLHGIEYRDEHEPLCNAADVAALESLYEVAGGTEWTESAGWLESPVLDGWWGVTADSLGRVAALALPANNLAGELPILSWENMAALTILDIADNPLLRGPLPSLAGAPLEVLRFRGTGLCTFEESRGWLAAIPTVEGTGEMCAFLSERGILTAFYEATDGPNWVDNTNWVTDAPLGDWYGVETDASGRVVQLDLSGRWDSEARGTIRHGLKGEIPSELGGLANLQSLELGRNQLTGGIPSELGKLTSLRTLGLYGNSLTGEIPSEIGNLVSLERLDLFGGDLSGEIPVEIGNLVNLRWLNVDSNRLTGEIPLELGELTNLRTLALQANLLTGEIPRELGNLASLRGLYLGYNDFTGPIPAELGNLAALTRLGLERNDFSGPIPSSFLHLDLARIRIHGNDSLCIPGTSVFVSWLRGIEYRDEQEPLCNAADVAVLQSLYELAGGPAWTESAGWLGDDGVEDWYGVTADSLGHVTILDLGRNGLRGQLPAHIDGLAHMTELRMSGNEGLSGRLPLVLTRLSLRVLHYAETGLCAPGDALFQAWLTRVESQEGTGLECPPLSDREILEVLYHAASGPDWTNSENWLTDAPLREWHGIDTDREGEVVGLVLFDNGLVGRIPPELGRLTALQRLVLWRNGLTGPIPPELGNLANLQRLNLVTNALEGPIPAELGDLTRLWELDLGNNTLEGPIPAKLGKLTSLTRLHLVGNDLTGSIPAALGNLVNLWELSLGRNALTGSLPAELGEIARLERFYAGHNDLSGPVPPEFGELTELREIALSSNADMTGALPSSLINLRSLETFEASGTQLCAPSDGAFLEWLEGLPNPRVPQCERTPSAAYLVQAVQSREFPVPLVAGEEALLRVFVTATQANRERLPPVRASFHLNGALAHVADLSGKAGPIPTSVDEGSLATSANEVIPATVVQPGLEMVIEIDPEGTLDPALGIAKRIPAEGRLSVNVLEMPLFDLTIIPFLRTADPDSTILDAVASTIADPEEWLWRRRPYLPVGDLTVRAHEPVMSSTNDAYALLSQTRMIRAVEGGTGYFMGTMSRPVTRASGLAERGGWNLFSLLPGPTGHELGHSFGLSHAPCGRVTGTDPAYPYPDAQIGVWGYDPLDGVLVPPNRPDIMSYCGGWISDYHYAKALRHRLTKEGASAAAPATSLLLWGGTDSTSTPFLEPAFVVDAPALLPDSTGEHLITGRASDGAQLFSFSFTMPETADGDGSSSFAFVVPVRPALEGQLASITLTGPGGSATLDGDSDEPMVILRNTRNGQVRGILRDVPPPAQTAADAVGQTVGPGLETLFSRGIPGEAAWRR